MADLREEVRSKIAPLSSKIGAVFGRSHHQAKLIASDRFLFDIYLASAKHLFSNLAHCRMIRLQPETSRRNYLSLHYKQNPRITFSRARWGIILSSFSRLFIGIVPCAT